MCFQFGVQFENLFKLVCQGGTADCLLYRTHVGRFDTTCAGNGAEQKKKKNLRQRKTVSSDTQRCEKREGEKKKGRNETGVRE